MMKLTKFSFHSLLFAGLLAFSGLPLLLHAGSAEARTVAGKVHKVIFQVSDNNPHKWNLTLNNVRNLQKALGKERVRIEVVAYGPGIGMLKMDSVVGNRVNKAVKNGAKIMACENTMRGKHLSKSDMLPSVGYVPAGVVELMKKQEQGYAYIRP